VRFRRSARRFFGNDYGSEGRGFKSSLARKTHSARNDRRPRTSKSGWVVNGDVWTVIAVHPDGAADVRRHDDGSLITLPAGYLAEHAHLAYATTAHRAQA
jgi:hypothetical protein